jgi:AcrR family transcriptional regulator
MAGAPTRLTRAESRARTRAALLQAAAELFVERGLQGTSVEAIAERAGYTRGAFYSNFATKEELFAELLQSRVYAAFRAMLEAQLTSPDPLPTPRETAEALAAVQAHPDSRWLFPLWFELLSQTGRDDGLRELAAEFWRGNRGRIARIVERAAEERGTPPPLPAERMASALIAMDIGLAIQHWVDPQAVPLDAYPEVFGAIFGDEG